MRCGVAIKLITCHFGAKRKDIIMKYETCAAETVRQKYEAPRSALYAQ